ncbi:hypothetical protein N7451_001448 [Penicillium sp. IBT 35674x]|nr:hypothetical protein N7451_001448 [Penicillium sp. IBT 35674x]
MANEDNRQDGAPATAPVQDSQAILTGILTNPDSIALHRTPAPASNQAQAVTDGLKPDTSWKPAEIGFFNPSQPDKDGGFVLIRDVMHYTNAHLR